MNSKAILLNHTIFPVSMIMSRPFSHLHKKKNENFLSKWNCATVTVLHGFLYFVSQFYSYIYRHRRNSEVQMPVIFFMLKNIFSGY